MTPSIRPSARTWTLRFKHSRTTIFLHVDPLQKLSLIRAELLKAVQQSHPDGQLHGHVIPQDVDDVLLARPVDINDLDAGWEPLDKQDDLDEEMFVDGKGKGKATAGKTKARSANALQDCPQGAGLRDGGVVAFKFRSGDDATVGEDRDEGVEDMERLDGETLVGEPAGEKWDVIVPTLEEVYGEDDGEGEGEVPLPMNAK